MTLATEGHYRGDRELPDRNESERTDGFVNHKDQRPSLRKSDEGSTDCLKWLTR
jgi:hypothetical protein